MPESDDNERVKRAQDMRATTAQISGHKIVSHQDETWRPTGVCTSIPLSFRDTESVARETIEQFSGLPDIWQRNAALVRVVTADVYLGRDGQGKPKTGSQLSIQALDTPLISKFCCNATKFWKYNGHTPANGGHQWERCEPGPKVVNLIKVLAEYPRVPVLRGIVQSPSMRPDGSIIGTPGFDEQTGWFFRPNAEFLPVPDQPTPAQVQSSVRWLAEPFAAHPGYDSFPFVSDAHRWLPIAMALTLLARPGIDGCVPFFGFDATDAGTGKGMATDVASIIATGNEAPKSTFPSGNAEELEKILSSHALAGSQLICFDNVSGVVRGDALEKIATTPIVEFRILGASEIKRLAWNSVVAFTGNQLAFHGDTTRRTVSCRQESPIESPSKRSNFKHPDLIGWVKQKRPELVRAALTLLRAYVLSGDTQSKQIVKGFGSFERWSSLVPAAIHWATGVNVLECRPELESADPAREAECLLLRSLSALQDMRQVNGFSTKEIIDLAYTEEVVSYSPLTRGPVFPELREAVDTLIVSHVTDQRGRPSAISVGKMLDKRKGVTRSNLRLVAVRHNVSRVMIWSVKCMK